jgi:hypothetical protein
MGRRRHGVLAKRARAQDAAVKRHRATVITCMDSAMARAAFLFHLPSMSTPVAERPADQTARTHLDTPSPGTPDVETRTATPHRLGRRLIERFALIAFGLYHLPLLLNNYPTLGGGGFSDNGLAVSWGLVVGSVLLSSVAAMRGTLTERSVPSGLDGLWIVTSFALGGQAADTSRWSQVIVRGTNIAIRLSSNRFVSCQTTPTSTPDAMIAACSGNRRVELRWTRSGTNAQIDGTFDGARVTASARRTDRSDYRLMQSKFRWIID